MPHASRARVLRHGCVVAVASTRLARVAAVARDAAPQVAWNLAAPLEVGIRLVEARRLCSLRGDP